MFMIQPIESCTRRIYKAGFTRLRAIGSAMSVHTWTVDGTYLIAPLGPDGRLSGNFGL